CRHGSRDSAKQPRNSRFRLCEHRASGRDAGVITRVLVLRRVGVLLLLSACAHPAPAIVPPPRRPLARATLAVTAERGPTGAVELWRAELTRADTLRRAAEEVGGSIDARDVQIRSVCA